MKRVKIIKWIQRITRIKQLKELQEDMQMYGREKQEMKGKGNEGTPRES